MSDIQDRGIMSRSRQASSVSSPEGSESKSNPRSKTAIRVSVACVQCRSKHLKCDATMPACLRCTMDGKPCFYAKSRRGIRDPKKRSLISDKPPAQPPSLPFPQLPEAVSLHAPDRYLNHASSWDSVSKHGPSSTNEEGCLINLYFTYFHPSHPVIPPKPFFLKHVEADPDSMHFLVSALNFVGSLYAPHISSEELREAAFGAACGPLPITTQSVQGLLILSLAALGEMKFEYQNGWTDRAISMALEIGMQHKAFADTATDPVLAESFRRIYWGLYFHDCARNVRESGIGTSLHGVVSDVDLPCEEWEYDTGQIPQPISLAQYDIQNNLGRGEFSSWAYLVDLCRISSSLVLPYSNASEDKKQELFERADAMICDWLIKVPRWKMDLVDSEGVVDMVLFHSIAFAQQNRLKLRQCSSRQSLDLRQCFSLGPARGPHRQAQKIKAFGWNALPIDVQAANSVCDLFRHSFPIKYLSPMCLPGLLRVALAYLDACVFQGLDKPVFREKLHMLLRIMTVHGETWPISLKIAEEVREVEREYLSIPQHQIQTSCGDALMAAIATGAIPEDTMLTTEFNFPLYPELNDLEGWTHLSDHTINV